MWIYTFETSLYRGNYQLSCFIISTGQFMTKNVNIDMQREMLIYSDGRNPVPVTKDTAMTGKPCWKALNYGHQGEGLIKGTILNYVMPNILVNEYH